MARLALRFAPGAVAQLEEALDWWETNREKAPRLLATEFEAAVELLRNVPGAGIPYENGALVDARRYLLRRTRFHIYYVVRDKALIIAALWSGLRGHGPSLPGP